MNEQVWTSIAFSRHIARMAARIADEEGQPWLAERIAAICGREIAAVEEEVAKVAPKQPKPRKPAPRGKR
jgi:hypothetical protein